MLKKLLLKIFYSVLLAAHPSSTSVAWQILSATGANCKIYNYKLRHSTHKIRSKSVELFLIIALSITLLIHVTMSKLRIQDYQVILLYLNTDVRFYTQIFEGGMTGLSRIVVKNLTSPFKLIYCRIMRK